MTVLAKLGFVKARGAGYERAHVQVPFLDLASGDARIYWLNDMRGEPFYNSGSLLVQHQ